MSIIPHHEKPKSMNENAAKFMDYLFEQLKSIFPAWRTAWPNQEIINRAKREWIKAFVEQGITTTKQVKLGIKSCRNLKTDFIPSVGNFIDLCKPSPEHFGLPHVELAFNQALAGGLLHPIIDATVKAVGSYDIRTGTPTNKNLFNRFEYYYQIMIKRYANGEPLLNPVNRAICHGTEQPKGLDAVTQSIEQTVKKRIAEQGISLNAIEARQQALAMLGLKDRTKNSASSINDRVADARK